MEIYKHFYPGYGSVEEQFQKRYKKKPTIQREPESVSPVNPVNNKVLLDEDGNPLDLLEGIEDYMLGK